MLSGAARGASREVKDKLFRIAAHLLEAAVYDVPPSVRVIHEETPSPFTEFGVKGGGEGGRMVAPTALVCAVEDALRAFGVRVNELPMTPERIAPWIEASQP
jgi:CO/xanthine dehydrogenase Mo-binding subunit